MRMSAWLGLLERGIRDQPTRHRTVAWTLLLADAAGLSRLLAVFGAGWQRFLPTGFCSKAVEQRVSFDAQDSRELRDHVNAGAVDAVLERADIGPVDAGLKHERLLRIAFLVADLT
jgi:hypothetical protein